VATKQPKVVGVIPARYASSRFPGKALADVAGKPMIQRVYERCARASRLSRLYVATDDQRIFDAAKAFTDDVIMTAAEHPSGTDRVAEVAAQLEADVYVNIQGDEPLIEPAAVDAVAFPFDGDEDVLMATLARPFPPSAAPDLASTNFCKVVVDRNGDALYFTRAMVPFRFHPQVNIPYLKHVGIYAYRRDFLLRFTTLEPTPLEAAEGLEMLRALAHGFKIRVVIGDFTSRGVDTPEDLAAVVEFYLKENEEDAPA
jgi:3-deoxy-manno-octulosonate cytidylyltransferase (CMP-KDO synthetase)